MSLDQFGWLLFAIACVAYTFFVFFAKKKNKSVIRMLELFAWGVLAYIALMSVTSESKVLMLIVYIIAFVGVAGVFIDKVIKFTKSMDKK